MIVIKFNQLRCSFIAPIDALARFMDFYCAKGVLVEFYVNEQVASGLTNSQSIYVTENSIKPEAYKLILKPVASESMPKQFLFSTINSIEESKLFNTCFSKNKSYLSSGYDYCTTRTCSPIGEKYYGLLKVAPKVFCQTFEGQSEDLLSKLFEAAYDKNHLVIARAIKCHSSNVIFF